MAEGYGFLRGEELDRILADRRVPKDEIRQAVEALSGPDPAGVIPASAVTYDVVANIAAYLHLVQGRYVLADPVWNALVTVHPAARAIFWHEYQELHAYRSLGITDPLRVDRLEETYWRAHAKASWEEALYWFAWADVEEVDASAEAFFLATPLRVTADIRRARATLESFWGIRLKQPDAVELAKAREFYAAKHLSWREIRG